MKPNTCRYKSEKLKKIILNYLQYNTQIPRTINQRPKRDYQASDQMSKNELIREEMTAEWSVEFNKKSITDRNLHKQSSRRRGSEHQSLELLANVDLSKACDDVECSVKMNFV
ncbi:hypothetical protein WDU94_007554 [Cyamophila willieti]